MIATAKNKGGKLWIWAAGAALLAGGAVAAMQLHSPVLTPAAPQHSRPAAVVHAAPFVTLQGKTENLAMGRQKTLVVLMAPWCRFCAYDDKWVVPQLAKIPGIAIDLVDASDQVGLAKPGPQFPAFSGKDGKISAPVSSGRQRQVMQRYVQTLHLAHQSLHFYVASRSLQQKWHLKTYPVWLEVGPKGVIEKRLNGGLTYTQVIQAFHWGTVSTAAGHSA
ncbi:MAG: hypothetical protein OWS74_06075 [Firmicutes bacterium]|nr:hypothetical protein [Bacillota bacterium]